MKKRILPFILGISILTGCSISEMEQQAPAAPITTQTNDLSVKTLDKNKLETIEEGSFIGEVTHVVDGDTIAVKIVDGEAEEREVKLRFLLVDSPEWTTEKMPWGDKATERVKELLPKGTELKLYYDKGNKKDKYERHLVYVQLPNGEILQEKLLGEGLAIIRFVIPPGITMLPEFKAAEKKARQQKLNVWSLPGYVQPDGGFNPVVAERKSTEQSIKEATKEYIKGQVDDKAKNLLGEKGKDLADKAVQDGKDSLSGLVQ